MRFLAQNIQKSLNGAKMENHRKSRIKKKRKSGFLAKMRTKGGRNILSRRRRAKRSLKLR